MNGSYGKRHTYVHVTVCQWFVSSNFINSIQNFKSFENMCGRVRTNSLISASRHSHALGQYYSKIADVLYNLGRYELKYWMRKFRRSDRRKWKWKLFEMRSRLLTVPTLLKGVVTTSCIKYAWESRRMIYMIVLTSASEAFDTHPVLKILAGTTFTEEDAVHKSRIFTMLSNLMFTDGTSGATPSLAVTASDGAALLSSLLHLRRRIVGWDTNPWTMDRAMAKAGILMHTE